VDLKRLLIGVMVSRVLTAFSMLAVGSCEVSPKLEDDISSAPISASFDSLTGKLTVTGVRTVTTDVDWSSTKALVFEIPSIDGDEKPDLIRFLSTNYFGALGQRSGDVVIYSRNIQADLVKSDIRNLIADEYPLVPDISSHDASFANIRWLIRRLNRLQGRSLCDDDNGHDLLDGLRGGLCYVSCSGQSMIAADLLPGFARVALLYADAVPLTSNTTFMQSEWHTTVEYVHDGRWYVADPTFGFAYVKDKSGRRLDTRELIDALMKKRANELTFAVVRRGRVHAVPGEKFLDREATLSSMYYTPDKRVEYIARY